MYYFGNPNISYDIYVFLRELKSVIDNRYHTIEVMGGVHADPWGHTSYMMGQVNDYGEFVPVLTKDKYIRFKLVVDNKHPRQFAALNTTSIFHLLVQVPEIVKIPLHVSVPVQKSPRIKKVLEISDPSSHYKSLKFSKDPAP